MQMRFKDVTDLQILFLRGFQIDLYVTLRIDDHSFAFRAQQIRCVRQTSQVELFEYISLQSAHHDIEVPGN